MALPWRTISENIINISKVLNDFLDPVHDKDILWITRDQLGNVTEKEIPNLSKIVNIFNRRYLGAYDTPPETRPDSAPIAPGDYYLDLGKKRLVYFDGSNWLDILPSTDKSNDLSVLAGSTPPDEKLTAEVGTLYIDYSERKLYVVTKVIEDDEGGSIAKWELVDGAIREYITETPVISGPATAVENTSEKYTIANFDSDNIYEINVLSGKINYNPGSDYFIYNAPIVEADSTDRITVTASAPGKLSSSPAVLNITIVNVNEEADQQIIDSNIPDNTAETDGIA